MAKKKILIVSKEFYPIISPRSFRTTELAKELGRQGHKVVVLTHVQNYSYETLEKDFNIRIENFVGQKWKEIKSNNLLVKILNYGLRYFFLFPDIQLIPYLKKALTYKRGFDLLISIAHPYPIHWGVALAKQKNKQLTKVWVADCGDPFMGNKEITLKWPFYFKYIEKWFCNKPNYITVPIYEAISAFPSNCQSKIKVIPQGFNFKEYPNSQILTNRKNKYPVFVYAGTLDRRIRNPKKLLNFLSLQTDINFKFIIYTKNQKIVEKHIKKLGQKLEIRNYIPRKKLLLELSSVDFVVNFENKNTVQKPSKLIDYALLNKPILSIKANNVDFNLVKAFLNGNYSRRLIVEDIEQYDIAHVAMQFVNLLNTKD